MSRLSTSLPSYNHINLNDLKGWSARDNWASFDLVEIKCQNEIAFEVVSLFLYFWHIPPQSQPISFLGYVTSKFWTGWMLSKATRFFFFGKLLSPYDLKNYTDVCLIWLALQSPSSIYSWSISHILEHKLFCLGCLWSSGSKKKRWIWVFLSNFWGCFF